MQKNFFDHPLKVFMSYYRPHRRMFAIDLSCAVLASAVDLIFPYVSKTSMQRYLPEKLYTTFFIVMAIVAASYVVKALLYYVIAYVGHTMGTLIEADMRSDIFRHMQNLSYSFYDKNRTGVLMSRITNDLFDITELAHHGPENFLICTLTLAGSIIILFTIQWKLALVILILVPLCIAMTVKQRIKLRNTNIEVKKKTAEINAAIESGISGIRTAKAFAAESAEGEKFEKSNALFKTAKAVYYKTFGKFMASMEFTVGIVPVAVIAFGGFLIMRGEMGYIELITFSLYISTFISPVRRLVQFMEQYMQGSAGFLRFLEVMRTAPEIEDAPEAEELTTVKGSIRFDNVSFSYKEDTETLSGVSFHINPGESLALVGPSGGGKTTICHLLPRFYDVSSGSVSVDGKDVRSLTQESLRKNIGIIQQDVFIFADTIKENIRYGRPDATDEEVVEAAVRAEIHREIMEMPDGYDTYIGERGVMLSGGQKQRVSIARVFLKDPPILILDEATSALDSVTEHKIQESLEKLGEGRTCLVIAHRLSTIRDADRIAVIEGGRLTESGTHGELLAKNGDYAALWHAQNG